MLTDTIDQYLPTLSLLTNTSIEALNLLVTNAVTDEVLISKSRQIKVDKAGSEINSIQIEGRDTSGRCTRLSSWVWAEYHHDRPSAKRFESRI